MKLKTRSLEFKADAVDDAGTFSGYGSVFGNADSYGEIVMAGAFTDSIKRIKASGDPLPMLWNHNSNEPIGSYDTLSEDDRGLKVSGALMIDEIPRAKQVHALMKKRVVKSMSIGYYVEDAFYDEKRGLYMLKKLDLREVSPVMFPANEQADIEEVKALLAKGMSIREFEGVLREAGFSRKQAEGIAARGFAALDRGEPEADAIKKSALFDFQFPTNF